MSALIVDGRRFESSDPNLFIGAYQAGKTAVQRGEDTHALYRQLLAQGDAAAVAGYLQGLAASAREQMPEHPVGCPCRHCVHDREALMRHIHRVWREAVPA
ncbi:hypothetical protein ACIPXV_09155 [Streptomyces libani]|uniref:hypothetical protein n=1 Tax=Streptomyces nigrescens TaxID=1920 RepID=UPI003821AD03